MSVLSLVSDPDFQKLSPDEQQSTLGTLDPAFHDLKSEDFSATVGALQKKALSRPDLVSPPQAAAPVPEGLQDKPAYSPKDLGPTKDLIGGRAGAYEASMPKGVAAQVPVGMAKGAADFAYNAGKDLLIPTAPKMSEEQKAQHPTIAKIQQYTNPKEHLPEHILIPKNAGEQTGSEASQYGLTALGAIALPEAAEGAASLIRSARTPKGASALGEIASASAPRTAAIPEKPSIGRISKEEAPVEPLIKKPSAPAEAAVKPSEPREYSPEDETKVKKTITELPNADLQSLGKRLGLDESKYDFSKREAVREGGSKHPVDRIRWIDDLKLPDELKNHIVDAENDWNAANPQTFESPARSSKFWADRSKAIVNDAVNRWQPETEKPSIGAGAKVKSLGKVTQALMKSLQVSPEKVLNELGGTEGQIRTRLLTANKEDLARWK